MNANAVFPQWEQVRTGLFQALDMLTDVQLAFTPHEGLWSLGQVACHIAGAEEGWFRYVVTHEISGWEEADFQASAYPTVMAVKNLLNEVHARTQAFLEQVPFSEVDRLIELPWGPKIPLSEVIWHVLEHEIHHRGEVYLMLGLLGMEAPDV